jgi:hypothetical protein
VSVAGVNYEVDPDLAGETFILWWGIFDNELFVEHGDKRFGPYSPVGGPIPLYRYRTFKKSPTQQRADRIEALADQLALPWAALEGNPRAASLIRNTEEPVTMFTDPDPFQKFTYPNALAAKRAIADWPFRLLRSNPSPRRGCEIVHYPAPLSSRAVSVIQESIRSINRFVLLNRAPEYTLFSPSAQRPSHPAAAQRRTFGASAVAMPFIVECQGSVSRGDSTDKGQWCYRLAVECSP